MSYVFVICVIDADVKLYGFIPDDVLMICEKD